MLEKILGAILMGGALLIPALFFVGFVVSQLLPAPGGGGSGGDITITVNGGK